MNKKIEGKRIIALITVILIVFLLIATLIVAIISFPGSDYVFMGLVGLDIIVPVLAWFFMLVHKQARQRFTDSLNEEDKTNNHSKEDTDDN